MREVGDRLGVTHERIRQLFFENDAGILNGGIVFKTAKRFGLTADEYGHFFEKFGRFGNSPLKRFRQQWVGAKRRGIPWQITFTQWWKIWTDSGKWEQRGRGSKFVMARFGDVGPYAVGNVEIITGAQNVRDYFSRRYP